MAHELINTCSNLMKTVTRIPEANHYYGQHPNMLEEERKKLTAKFKAEESKATALVKILCDSIQAWVLIKKQSLNNDEATAFIEDKNIKGPVSIRQRNLPIVKLIKETVGRFLEVIGVRPETPAGGPFGRSMHFDQKVALDWTVDRPDSELATSLLELVRVCFKDLRAPDFNEDLYM